MPLSRQMGELLRRRQAAAPGVSAVSKRITELEEGIGSSPLLRLPRGVTPTPTPAGRSLLRHLRVLLDATAGDVA